MSFDDNKLVRTDVHCTECGKNFIALLDYNVEGEHVAQCPYCGHSHYRLIVDGEVTETRWKSATGNPGAARCQVWRSPNDPIVTSMAGAFMRERWLNRDDAGVT